MTNEMFLGFTYIIIFLAMFIISFKIISESNFDKIFKQGQVKYIRVGYIVTSIIIAFLFSKAITSFVEAIISIIQK